jgi:hypothetical protein
MMGAPAGTPLPDVPKPAHPKLPPDLGSAPAPAAV